MLHLQFFEAANKFRSRDSDNSVFGNSSTVLFLCKSAVGQNVYKYQPQGRQKSSGKNWLEEQNMYSYLTQGGQQTLVNMQPRNMAFIAETQQQSRKDDGVLMFLMYQGGKLTSSESSLNY